MVNNGQMNLAQLLGTHFNAQVITDEDIEFRLKGLKAKLPEIWGVLDEGLEQKGYVLRERKGESRIVTREDNGQRVRGYLSINYKPKTKKLIGSFIERPY